MLNQINEVILEFKENNRNSPNVILMGKKQIELLYNYLKENCLINYESLDEFIINLKEMTLYGMEVILVNSNVLKAEYLYYKKCNSCKWAYKAINVYLKCPKCGNKDSTLITKDEINNQSEWKILQLEKYSNQLDSIITLHERILYDI